MKQVFQNKAGSGIGRGIQPESWMDRYQHDSTKMGLFPVLEAREKTLPYASKLDALAHARTTRSARSVLDGTGWKSGSDLRKALDERHKSDFADFTQMIALQDELDWLCYTLYGLDTRERRRHARPGRSVPADLAAVEPHLRRTRRTEPRDAHAG
jgi:hypothetical protein